ncbi:MAG: AmmeMemoRadiSam system radical SAM enzyme, partial [Candidatus Thermoplasmatota archaeon]|nr:AmmeMemoRadiSam system radical SAM enzyme [Candidatus Thermoplasmatota archaeon]
MQRSILKQGNEAMLWSSVEGGVECALCSHRCRIAEGSRGICGVREARDGKLFSLIYGKASSIAVDPVEKKPLYHFRPASRVFSLGTVGCNFRCLNCQNNDISWAKPDAAFLRNIKAKEVSEMALERQCTAIAWTYNEPTIWYEFTLAASREAKKKGLDVIYVTNGFMTSEALEKHAPCIDAMNIDVKSFRDDFYKKVVRGRLEPVLDTCKNARELGIHVELTYLVIPTLNDSPEELRDFVRWSVDNMGPDTPLHFSRFFPQNKLTNLPPTPIDALENAYNIATEEGARYVYVGNVRGGEHEDTRCPGCGEVVIKRTGYSTRNRLVG